MITFDSPDLKGGGEAAEHAAAVKRAAAERLAAEQAAAAKRAAAEQAAAEQAAAERVVAEQAAAARAAAKRAVAERAGVERAVEEAMAEQVAASTKEYSAQLIQLKWRDHLQSVISSNNLMTIEFRLGTRRAGRQLLHAWLSWKRLAVPKRESGAGSPSKGRQSWGARLAARLVGV